MCVCVCLSDLSLTVVWVIPGKLNIPVHAQEFASDHECCQPHMVARYLSMYVYVEACPCPHKFLFSLFFHFPPPFGHVSRLNTPPAVRLAAVCIEMKSFCQPLFYFCYVFSGQAENVFCVVVVVAAADEFPLSH